jgi:hypothetical protein
MPQDHPARYVPAAVVSYRPATDRRGSQWAATIDRGGPGHRFRAAVPYADGPDQAAAAVVAKANRAMGVTWAVAGPALSLDAGARYAYPVAAE